MKLRRKMRESNQPTFCHENVSNLLKRSCWWLLFVQRNPSPSKLSVDFTKHGTLKYDDIIAS